MKLNKRNKGSFLLEMLVGMLMSLVTVLGILIVYSQFEGQKRTANQKGQSTAGASIGLFPLQEYGRVAGFGFHEAFNDLNIKYMNRVVHYSTNTSGTHVGGTFLLNPATITFGSNVRESFASDSIRFLSSSASNFFAPYKVHTDVSNTSSTIEVDTRFGVEVGDTIILLSTNQTAEHSLHEVVAKSGSADAHTLTVSNSNYVKAGKSTAAVFNSDSKFSGLSNVAYPVVAGVSEASAINMGFAPNLQEFIVSNRQLKIRHLLHRAGVQESVLADNVLFLKAVYGYDKDSDRSIGDDEWYDQAKVNAINTDADATNDFDFSRVLGVHVAILARSALREKADENGICQTTVNESIGWEHGTFHLDQTPTDSDDDDWRCFRYQVLQTTIPFKNMIWRQYPR